MIGDLHCHSVCSDGYNTTDEIVAYAIRKGLTHIALTDHDTMMGVARITDQARPKGLTVVPGVECTTVDNRRGQPVHLLCYAPKDAEALQTFLNTTLERRREAKLAMADKIAGLYPLTREDVLTFVERIEVGPKIYPEGANPAARKNPVFTQSVRIFYKFIGEAAEAPENAPFDM